MNGYLMNTYARLPVRFERGEGVWLWDTEGNRYLDALAGVAVCNLGHAHPAVARTLAEQSRKLLHVSNLFGNEHNEALAGTLDRLLGGGGQVFFTNSGAEANEAAIKLARQYHIERGNTTKYKIISRSISYHGATIGALSMVQ